MKKIFLFLITSIVCTSSIGCSVNNEKYHSSALNNSSSFNIDSTIYNSTNEHKYPEYQDYYVQNAYELVVVCWQIEQNLWRCGLVATGAMIYPLELIHIQYCIPCELSIMKEILSTYSESVIEHTSVFEINYPNPTGKYQGTISNANNNFLRDELGLPSFKDNLKQENNLIASYNLANSSSRDNQTSNNIPFEYIPGNCGTKLDYIICWQIEQNEWRSGLFNCFHGNDGTHTLEYRHMQECIPCSLEDMKAILSLYPEDKREPNLGVLEVKFPFGVSGKYCGNENIEYLKKELELS